MAGQGPDLAMRTLHLPKNLGVRKKTSLMGHSWGRGWLHVTPAPSSERQKPRKRKPIDPSYSYQITNYLIPAPYLNVTESEDNLGPVPEPVVDDDRSPVPESEDDLV